LPWQREAAETAPAAANEGNVLLSVFLGGASRPDRIPAVLLVRRRGHAFEWLLEPLRFASARPNCLRYIATLLAVRWGAGRFSLFSSGLRRFVHRQSKKASVLRSHHEETRELPGESENARNNARCTQARKTTHGLDGQHQDMDRTPCGRVSQNDRGQR